MAASNGLEKFSHLEDKIYRTIELTKALRQEKEDLERRLATARSGSSRELGEQIDHLIAEREAIDVAVLDIAMPALDGFGLARRLRSEMDSPPHLVALTGFGDESNRTEATQAGFEAYFQKPADWSALQSLLANYAAH